jgi:hypothetical protein
LGEKNEKNEKTRKREIPQSLENKGAQYDEELLDPRFSIILENPRFFSNGSRNFRSQNENEENSRISRFSSQQLEQLNMIRDANDDLFSVTNMKEESCLLLPES